MGSDIEEGGIPYPVDELDMAVEAKAMRCEAPSSPPKEKGFFSSLKEKLFGGEKKSKKLAAAPKAMMEDMCMKE